MTEGETEQDARPTLMEKGGFLRSPLTRRVLAVNLLGPFMLVVGLLYLDDYRTALYDAELNALKVQAELIATALAEGAVGEVPASGGELLGQAVATHDLNSNHAEQIIRRSVTSVNVRVRLFDANGLLMLDSYNLPGPGLVQVTPLQPIEPESALSRFMRALYRTSLDWLTKGENLPRYEEKPDQSAEDYVEVWYALDGEARTMLRTMGGGQKILSTAVPVQFYKEVVGGIMLSRDSEVIENNLLAVHLTIFKLFLAIMGVTVLISLYMARTITTPLRHLAAAAEKVRSGQWRRHAVPEVARRNDEIGELSTALSEMTEALWTRMDAIERFAADVAHEIKNPLTSLRSAVETVARIKDSKQQQQLMTIIQDDVQRLDRLISDISDASRLDAELSRAASGPVDMGAMVETLAQVHQATAADHHATLVVKRTEGKDLTVLGMEGRLVQVLRNLIANAASFSPEDGVITVRAGLTKDNFVKITVEDQGPGIPPGSEQTIFHRFYSERPADEKFGTHSGLGLSISQQIVEAHRGTIGAENILDEEGRVMGARFVVRLPGS